VALRGYPFSSKCASLEDGWPVVVMKAVADEVLTVAAPLASGPCEFSGLGVDRECWADAFLIRAFEQRLLRLVSEGRLSGTVHTCVGQELTGVAVARSLGSLDTVFSNHRCHGHYLARTRDVDGLMAEIMGRASGVCGGRGGSQHLCGPGFFSSGVQGGFMPVATGLSMAKKLRGDGGIAVVFIGDGTLGEGIVYETLNLASKWKLPLAVVLEDNFYAQSTSQRQALAGDIRLRAEAFGVQTFHTAVWAPDDLFRTVADAMNSYSEAGSLQAAFEEEKIFVAVFQHQQDGNLIGATSHSFVRRGLSSTPGNQS